MPRNVLEFRVVIASPSDVYASRRVVTDVIHELNRTFELQKIVIRALGWEENASPGVADEAQQVISQQILREYDILVAIFGKTIGSPTKSAPSGTVEEIEHALSQSNRQMGPYRVQVYFLDRVEGLSSGAVAELQKVAEYRDTLSTKGVFYRTFSNDNELGREIRTHLHRAVVEYLSSSHEAGQFDAAPSSMPTSSQNAPVAVSKVEEQGWLDYAEQAETAVTDAMAAIDGIATLVNEIGAGMERQTTELERVSSPTMPASQKKKVINEFANYLKSRAVQIKEQAALAKAALITYTGVMTVVIEIERDSQETSTYKEGLAAFLAAAEGLLQSLARSRTAMLDFARIMESFPRITTQFNQAKRLLLEATKESIEVVDQFEQAIFTITATG